MDHEQRRRDIVRAASRLLVSEGLRGVTFAAVAAELGGSTTMVTHYYRTIADLLDDLGARSVTLWQSEAEEVMGRHPDDPVAQLRAVLFEWMTPLEGEALEQERVRFMLLGSRSLGDETQRLFDSWEEGQREMFRRCVRPLVPDDEVEGIADVLRMTFNGLALSTVEHPDYWTAERQHRVLETIVRSLDLAAPGT